MDAVKFLKERNRMCEEAGWGCRSCYLVKKTDKTCWTLEADDIDKAIKAVGDWSKEHPIKTRQSEFLKLFPNARKHGYNTSLLEIRPCDIDAEWGEIHCELSNTCTDCRKDYWSEDVK